LALQGRSRTYSTLAASVTSRILELRKELIKESLGSSQSPEHQLEFVANIHGIEFINDSRACTINATWFALESINRPVIWIAGGADRRNDYATIRDLVEKKVKAILLLGESQNILEVFKGTEIPVIRVKDMGEAVETAYYLAKTGDCVLLSPACPSFDMFENFEARGVAYKNAVKNL
ncbi:MAG: UDP-N-acetylmuramoyl-L-alanine--D-glutamate ligase, partial [Bacteroidota bacterium]